MMRKLLKNTKLLWLYLSLAYTILERNAEELLVLMYLLGTIALTASNTDIKL